MTERLNTHKCIFQTQIDLTYFWLVQILPPLKVQLRLSLLQMRSHVQWTWSDYYFSHNWPCESSGTFPTMYCLTSMDSCFFNKILSSLRSEEMFYSSVFSVFFQCRAQSRFLINVRDSLIRLWMLTWGINSPLDTRLLSQFFPSYWWETQKRSFSYSEKWSESAEHKPVFPSSVDKAWYLVPGAKTYMKW